MTAYQAMTALAAAGGLLLAAMALRGRPGPLMVPLALLAVNQFAWNVPTLALEYGGDEGWRWFGALAAPFFPAFEFHFILAFLGSRVRDRRLLRAVYAVYGAQSAWVAVAWAVPALRPADPFGTFSLAHLVCDLPLLVYAVVRLVRHLRAVGSGPERQRTAMLLGALGVFFAFVLTDIFADMGVPVRGLGNVGSVAFNSVLAVITFSLGVHSPLKTREGLWLALLLAVLAGVTYLAVFVLGRGDAGILVVGAAVVTLGLAALLNYAVAQLEAERHALQRLALVGRFSAQMAHDLKGPLTMVQATADYLDGVAEQHQLPEVKEASRDLHEAVERQSRLIERYRRLGALELALSQVDLNDVARRVSGAWKSAARQVELRLELAPEALVLSADEDLLTSALENLLKNALEATPAGGEVVVRTRAAPGPGGSAQLEVQDTGGGMNAREREQAFELFRTSKPGGSGLGLNFVRSVARAHTGAVEIDSGEGRGTRVTLTLPLEPPTRYPPTASQVRKPR